MPPKLPLEFSPGGEPSGALRPSANCTLQQRSLVAFPTVLTELRDDVSAAEQQQALENWQEAWSGKSTSDWRACYEACRDAFEGPD